MNKKNYVIFYRYNGTENRYMTSYKPNHFDTGNAVEAKRFTQLQAIKIKNELRAIANRNYSYGYSYGYHTIDE
jgi:hypothetical protein